MSIALNILSGMAGINETNETSGSFGDALPMIIAGLAIVRFAPNAVQIMAYQDQDNSGRWYRWKPNTKWAWFIIALLFTALYYIVYNSNRISEFIYFQF